MKKTILTTPDVFAIAEFQRYVISERSAASCGSLKGKDENFYNVIRSFDENCAKSITFYQLAHFRWKCLDL